MPTVPPCPPLQCGSLSALRSESWCDWGPGDGIHMWLVGFPGLFGGSHVREAFWCQAHIGPRGEGRRGQSVLLREPQMGGPHSCLSWGPATLTQEPVQSWNWFLYGKTENIIKIKIKPVLKKPAPGVSTSCLWPSSGMRPQPQGSKRMRAFCPTFPILSPS